MLAALTGSLVLCVSCGGSAGLQRPQGSFGSTTTAQTLPFHDAAEAPSDDNLRPSIPAAARFREPAIVHPAVHSVAIPGGTLVTVRLDDTMFVSRAHAGDTFTASLVEPLIISGETAIKSGEQVSGRVELTQLPDPQSDRKLVPGYARLTLTAINLDHRVIPVQTSSLFAKTDIPSWARKAGVYQRKDSRIMRGRLLTFRLSAALSISDYKSLANR